MTADALAVLTAHARPMKGERTPARTLSGGTPRPDSLAVLDSNIGYPTVEVRQSLYATAPRQRTLAEHRAAARMGLRAACEYLRHMRGMARIGSRQTTARGSDERPRPYAAHIAHRALIAHLAAWFRHLLALLALVTIRRRRERERTARPLRLPASPVTLVRTLSAAPHAPAATACIA